MSSPEITVITAVYNGEDSIGQCIESIRAQTFGDYEHVIVNDGSTDRTADILADWQKRDERIRVLSNNGNKGRSISRNRAITASRAPLIAVLDADDYSLPQRLELQYAFMRENPEIQLVGADMTIHESGERLSHPRENDAIRAQLFFDSSLFHSTVMMRKEILNETKSWYDAELPLAQDYGLWAALMVHPKALFANLPDPLTVYRVPENPRPGYQQKQFNMANIVRGRILKSLGINPDKKIFTAHLALLYANADSFGRTPEECLAHGKMLLNANDKTKLTTREALESHLTRRLTRLTQNSARSHVN